MYTPTEQRMLDLLSDGAIHTKEELFRCLWDELSRVETIQKHLSLLRKKLRPGGHGVMCDHLYRYRLVRLIQK
jgi:DNA-binding response OmpR family regulator